MSALPEITACRVCGNKTLVEILDLGEQHVSDFRKDLTLPPKYPIIAVICERCMLVQLRHTTPSHDMYHENYGFKSGISDSIKNDLRDIAYNAQEYKQNPKSWLDIASNDGTLLSFVPTNAYRVGVDPITKLCKEAEKHADLVINDFYSLEALSDNTLPYFDVVTSISCFYDMYNPNVFVSDVEAVMADDGVWIVQQNYLLPTMQLGAIDNFCHEHLEYYTLLSLENLLARHDLEVFDLSTSMVNGGSLRTLICKKGAYPIQDSVEEQRTIEKDAGLHDIKIYLRFVSEAKKNIEKLKKLVLDMHSEGKRIAILAASTRGATIWQAAGLNSKQIGYAIERNPDKVGKYFSAIGVPIVSEQFAREDKPNYEIIGPWFFSKEIVEREKEYVMNGGCLIIPLPKLKVIDAGNILSYLRTTD